MMKQVFVFFAASCMAAVAFAANDGMMRKHKGLECAACHVNGTDKAVEKAQCQSCHPASAFEKGYELKNGQANPHVPLHYDPATIDCALCHREHGLSMNYCTSCHADGLGFEVP